MDKEVRADQNEKMSSDMMPVGFGTWKIPRDVTATVVYEAIKFAQVSFRDSCLTI